MKIFKHSFFKILKSIFLQDEDGRSDEEKSVLENGKSVLENVKSDLENDNNDLENGNLDVGLNNENKEPGSSL